MEEKEIMYDSDEAATFKTGISGWVSSKGHFYGKNEQSARYDGSTHRVGTCGHKTKHPYTICEECRRVKGKNKYLSMPYVEWDMKTPVCLFDDDKYFFFYEEVFEYCEDNDIEVCDLRLCICTPNHFTEVEVDSIAPEDEAPEDYDGDLPKEIQGALDNLNKIIREFKKPFTWSQGKQRTSVVLK